MAEEQTATIEQRIKQMIPTITEQVAADLRQKAIAQLEYQVSSAIAEECKKYIAEALIPQVRKELEKHETEFKAAMVAAMQEAFNLTAVKIVETATKRINEYDGAKLLGEFVDKIFGRRY